MSIARVTGEVMPEPLQDIVAELPDCIERATQMMKDALRRFRRSALEQAVVAAYARHEFFDDDAREWGLWCREELGIKRRYAITLWHAGDMLLDRRTVRYSAQLSGCTPDKLEALGKLSDGELEMFLENNDPAEMELDELRRKIRGAYLQEPGGGEEQREKRLPPRKQEPERPLEIAIERLSALDDETKRAFADCITPAGGMQAACNCLEMVLHNLRESEMWCSVHFRRWRPVLDEIMDVFGALEESAQRRDAEIEGDG